MDPVLLDSSFLIDLEREIDSGVAGRAFAWLRKQKTKRQRALMVSCVSIAEFLEGCEDSVDGTGFLSQFTPQVMGQRQAVKCAEIQRRAGKKGSRFGENDAWQLAFAETSRASIVGRDTKAFTHLGHRYEQY